MLDFKNKRFCLKFFSGLYLANSIWFHFILFYSIYNTANSIILYTLIYESIFWFYIFNIILFILINTNIFVHILTWLYFL